MDWFDLAQNSDKWRALANAVVNSGASQRVGNFLTS
jgi:hypothetical protein